MDLSLTLTLISGGKHHLCTLMVLKAKTGSNASLPVSRLASEFDFAAAEKQRLGVVGDWG